MQQVNAVEYNGVVKSYDRGVRALDGLTLVSGGAGYITAGIVIVGWGGKALGKYRHVRAGSN